MKNIEMRINLQKASSEFIRAFWRFKKVKRRRKFILRRSSTINNVFSTINIAWKEKDLAKKKITFGLARQEVGKKVNDFVGLHERFYQLNMKYDIDLQKITQQTVILRRNFY
jgi:hypothetical protein